MRKMLFVIAMIQGIVINADSQGTIAFNDLLSGGGTVELSPGVPYNGTFTVQLMYGVIGTSIRNLTPGPIFTSSLGDGAFLDEDTVTLLGIPAGEDDGTQSVELAIIAWTGSYPDLPDAEDAGALFAETQEFTNPTGGGGSPAYPAAKLVNWTAANSIVFVPEPSTMALGGLGAAALSLFRRRK